MTIRTAREALQAANDKKTNVPNTCQATVRGYYLAPSVGDFDGDGASDAEDGGKSEPESARRFDRTGRVGYPATFFGGRLDNGHRAIFVAPGIVRSTDFNGVTKRYDPGVMGNGTVAQVEAAMTSPGHTPVKFAFWSTTIDGQPIPSGIRPKPMTKGWRVEKSERLIKHAESRPGTKRARLLRRISNLFDRVPKF